MSGFFIRQINDIRDDGVFVLFKKVYKFLLVVMAIPMVIIIRLLAPFVLLRFGRIPCSRIGSFSTLPELYLCERNLGINNRTFDFFCCNGKVANYQLKKMWERALYISDFVDPVLFANKLLPGYKKHTVIIHNNNEYDYRGLLATSPVNISFTEEEKHYAQETLQMRGIPLNSKFICFSSRDSVYLNTIIPKNDWSYHDYRDFSIYNCVSAVEELSKRGYFVFRMGAATKEVLDTDNPKIIDYANRFRDEFLDIYLLGNCYFFLGSLSGINSVPMIFRRPRAVVNVIPISDVHTWMPDDLFIPKKLWLKKEHRFMTFRDIFESGVSRFLRTELYDQVGIEVVNNTSEEITALAVEMDERLKGTWQTTEENEELQRRFWKIFKKHANPKLHGEYRARIGANFLKQNRYLLE